ncbi:MAG: guanine deaminase [Pseudomonadales bacterium]|nr:guanine deaminase [Pseudomonadales bacterium]NRA14608.1 guanine deaminase [Oceanospirillaceae bacterium]
MKKAAIAHRSAILHSLGDPHISGVEDSYEYFADGLLITEQGKITHLGDATELLAQYPDIEVRQHLNKLIVPGFIDTHIHYPQTGVIASYGEQLLDWLENYTFPAEAEFSDPQHCSRSAEFFLDELLKNGTTTALVFGTVHKSSVEAFFQAADKRHLRMIAGKVMMDRNAPDNLTDTAQSSYDDSRELIEKYHGKNRLHYAVTPRFAPTSTPEQLQFAGQLLTEFPDLYLHTHLSENKKEIEWVAQLFPDSKSYLDVYDQYNLLTPRSVFAHAIHLDDHEFQRLAQCQSAVAFCPTSNTFLGSGLFNLTKMQQHKVQVALGTDVGGGTSFSMLQTMQEAYKVCQLSGQQINPFKAFYLATLAGAQALQLTDKIGDLKVGTEADFVVLDLAATPLINNRMQSARSIEEQLFVLMILGDDRAIAQTYSFGECVYQS